MVVEATLGVVLLVVSIGGLRGRRVGDRWPFVTCLLLTGFVVVLSGGGALLALAVGRTTWNVWTAGTAWRDEVTLSVVLLGLPLLLVLALLLLLVGGARDRLLRRRAARRAQ